MKLKDWADKQGISYLTAWRWFKAGDPRLGNAYQSESGTIIVPDEPVPSELSMSSVQDSDVMAVILKKTVEFSKNEYAIEDFAAWILSNFTLKVKTTSEGPKYSRVKPKPEEVQNHFKQFLKPKGEKPKTNMFVAPPGALDDLVAKADDLTAQELAEQIEKVGVEVGAPISPADAPEVEDLMKDLSSAMTIAAASMTNSVTTYDDVTAKYGYEGGDIAGGVVVRSVDLTPQQFNYTGSTNYASSNFSLGDADTLGSSATLNAASIDYSWLNGVNKPLTLTVQPASVATFSPTQKELEAVTKVSEIAEKPKRGRKPSKGKK